MNTLTYVIIFSLLGGILSLIGGIILLSRQSSAHTLAKYATPYAAGALLAAVFLDIMKDGLEQANPQQTMFWALIGIVLFFIMERFLRWFHHHHDHKDKKKDPAVHLIVIGDTLHNALDGIAIAASFLISVPTGIVTTIAVATHEIPQEIGDFGLLLKKGLTRKKVLLVNAVSAIATTFTAVVTYKLGSGDSLPLGALLGLSAGFLLYIALSDIIPTIHQESNDRKLFEWQPILLLLGVLSVGISINLAHKYIDAGHNEAEHSVHDEHSTEKEDHSIDDHLHN